MANEVIPPTRQLPPEWGRVVDGVVLLTTLDDDERRMHALQELQRIGLGDAAFELASRRDSDRAQGVYQSHRRAAKFTLRQGWKRTLVLEDNFVFRDAAGLDLDALGRLVQRLPSGWFLLKLGHVPIFPTFDFRRRLWKGRALGNTAQIVSADFAAWFPEWRFVEGGLLRALKRLGPKKLDHFLLGEISHRTFLVQPSIVYVDGDLGRTTRWLPSSPRAQVMCQFLFPLAYVLVILYLFYRVWKLRLLWRYVVPQK